jgi:hypothetical protein
VGDKMTDSSDNQLYNQNGTLNIEGNNRLPVRSLKDGQGNKCFK